MCVFYWPTDFDADKQITRNDLCAIVDRLTLEPYISDADKWHIADVVCDRHTSAVFCVHCCLTHMLVRLPVQLLREMDLQHTGGIGEMEFIHAISKVPEFGTTFSFRL